MECILGMDSFWKTAIFGLILLAVIPLGMYGIEYIFNLQPFEVVMITLGSGACAIVLRFYTPWGNLKQKKVKSVD